MRYLTFIIMLIPLYCSSCRPSSTTNGAATKAHLDSIADYATNYAIIQPKELDYKLLGTRKIVLTSHINPVSSREIIEKLLYLDSISDEEIILYIRTTGGWLADGFAIVDVIESLKSKVSIHAIGTCDSTGVVVLQGATGKRVGHTWASIGPHFNLRDRDNGYSPEQSYKKRWVDIMTRKARMPAEWFSKSDDRVYYLSADQALEFGLIDEIQSNNTKKH
jgi:ATP-dependent Clp protease protease subunit